MGYFKNMVIAPQTKTELKKYGYSTVEDLVNAILNRDVVALINFLKDVINSPCFIRDALFWNNFIEYVDNAFCNEGELRKFSGMLAENENSEENAKRIIKIIADIDTRKKTLYVANLTRAYCAKSIGVEKYFKLSQVIVRLIDEDLIFLSENINDSFIQDVNSDRIDDFIACGLLTQIGGKFKYSSRAWDLVNFALKYDQPIDIPKQMPERQLINYVPIGEHEINNLFK